MINSYGNIHEGTLNQHYPNMTISISLSKVCVKWILLINVGVFSFAASADRGISTDRIFQLKNGPGVYLSDEYTGILERTRSPLAARKGSSQYFIVKIERDKRGLIFGISNFHEPAGLFLVRQSDSGIEDYGVKPTVLRVLSSTSFLMAVGGKARKYKYVESVESYIAKTVLVGSYVDSNGKFYQFSKDMATFPGRSFRYKIDFDLFMNEADRFAELSSTGVSRWYGYKVSGSRLYLYAEIPHTGAAEVSKFDFQHPQFILSQRERNERAGRGE
jgi:hypothetical protein